MVTVLAIDDSLLDEAQTLGRDRSGEETVNAALDPYVRRRKQQQILSLFGTIDYNNYDHKRERKSKRL